MTEQDDTAPVPGPPTGAPAAAPPPPGQAAEEAAGQQIADLERRPVAEHVAVFEAEHARLQQELSSIDQL